MEVEALKLWYTRAQQFLFESLAFSCELPQQNPWLTAEGSGSDIRETKKQQGQLVSPLTTSVFLTEITGGAVEDHAISKDAFPTGLSKNSSIFSSFSDILAGQFGVDIC